MPILLHIIDDPKFLNYCEETFCITGFTNIYCRSKDFTEVSKQNEYHIAIVHGLFYNKAVLLNNNIIEKPVIWFLWGADVFVLGQFFNKFIQGKTKRLRIKLAYNKSIKYGFKTLLKTVWPGIIDFQKSHREIIRAMERVDIVIPVVPGDYTLVKNAYGVEAPCFHMNYVSPIFKEKVNLHVNKRNILVGNSASFTNNHLEILDKLSSIDLQGRKVILPLSYGNKLYGDYIRRYAEKKLSKQQVCLVEFLTFQEYQKIIGTCGILIMNHLRQQALGNIIQGLYSGVHIYLNPHTTLFQFLKNKQFIFSKISDIKNLRNLTETEKLHNRRKSVDIFGKKVQHEKVTELVKSFLISKGAISSYKN